MNNNIDTTNQESDNVPIVKDPTKILPIKAFNSSKNLLAEDLESPRGLCSIDSRFQSMTQSQKFVGSQSERSLSVNKDDSESRYREHLDTSFNKNYSLNNIFMNNKMMMLGADSTKFSKTKSQRHALDPETNQESYNLQNLVITNANKSEIHLSIPKKQPNENCPNSARNYVKTNINHYKIGRQINLLDLGKNKSLGEFILRNQSVDNELTKSLVQNNTTIANLINKSNFSRENNFRKELEGKGKVYASEIKFQNNKVLAKKRESLSMSKKLLKNIGPMTRDPITISDVNKSHRKHLASMKNYISTCKLKEIKLLINERNYRRGHKNYDKSGLGANNISSSINNPLEFMTNINFEKKNVASDVKNSQYDRSWSKESVNNCSRDSDNIYSVQQANVRKDQNLTHLNISHFSKNSGFKLKSGKHMVEPLQSSVLKHARIFSGIPYRNEPFKKTAHKNIPNTLKKQKSELLTINKAIIVKTHSTETVNTNRSIIFLENCKKSETSPVLFEEKDKSHKKSLTREKQEQNSKKQSEISISIENLPEKKISSAKKTTNRERNYSLEIKGSDIRQNIDYSAFENEDHAGIKNCSRIFADQESS